MVQLAGRTTLNASLDVAAQLAELRGAQLITFFHESQRFAHDLACRAIVARCDLVADHAFEFWGEIDVQWHDTFLIGPAHPGLQATNNLLLGAQGATGLIAIVRPVWRRRPVAGVI